MPELVLIEGNEQVATKPDESLSPSLFTICSHFATISITFLRRLVSFLEPRLDGLRDIPTIQGPGPPLVRRRTRRSCSPRRRLCRWRRYGVFQFPSGATAGDSRRTRDVLSSYSVPLVEGSFRPTSDISELKAILANSD